MSRPQVVPIEATGTAFLTQLTANKRQIDASISAFWESYLRDVRLEYGDVSWRSVEAFSDVMARGGKRIRASLGEASYRMFGGSNEHVITGMGIVIEMINAYVLVVDDICDQSDMRRGGPSAHRALADWHAGDRLAGDSRHFGASIATLSAMLGVHEAMLALNRLPVSAERRIAAMNNLNRFLVITCHGQFQDLMNEATRTQLNQEVEDVLVWKTAYYTMANPLQFGAILAGAPESAMDTLLKYSLAAGRAFQISDDIIGIFGDDAQTGKHAADDIKQGKRTILSVKSLELAGSADRVFLEEKLGSAEVSEADMARCRQVMQDSGALAYARSELEASCAQANAVLDTGELPDTAGGTEFLRGLVQFISGRQA